MLTVIRDFSYEDYKALVEKYITYDSREINLQNRVIIPFLEFLIKNHNIDVVDTSTLYNRGKRNSKTLDNSKFMKKGFAPPDLILAKNWHLDNVNNAVEYLCALEIKSPVSARGEHICGKEFGKYRMHVQKEVQAHLEVNPIVILYDLTKECCYIHEEANKDKKISCNMVLGFDDHYMDGVTVVPELVPFEKYCQRIVNRTDNQYFEWLEKMQSEEENTIHIYGHSLGPADGDVLKQFIHASNTKTIVYSLFVLMK